MSPLTFLLLLFVGMGLLLAGISPPLIQQRVHPSDWYGFRTKRALSNSQIWYDVNAYAGKQSSHYHLVIFHYETASGGDEYRVYLPVVIRS